MAKKLGGCQFRGLPRQPRKRTRETSPFFSRFFPAGSTVLVRVNGQWFLCRLSKGYVSFTEKPIETLEFDGSVCILEKDRNFVRHLREKYCSAITLRLVSGRAMSSSLTVDVRPHATPFFQESDPDAAVIVNTKLSPILSIWLEEVSNPQYSANPLLCTAVKRNLVGTTIAWVKGEISTSLLVHVGNQSLKFLVKRVDDAHTPFNEQSKSTYTLYQILPSTRITLCEVKGPPQEEEKATANMKMQKIASFLSKALMSSVTALRSPGTASLAVPKSFLLHGPEGVGKTYDAQKSVTYLSEGGPCYLTILNGSEIASGGNVAGSTRLLESHFRAAGIHVRHDSSAVALVLIDQCDSLFANELMVGALAALLDTIYENLYYRRMFLVAATHRIQGVPETLRRPGRFDYEFQLSPPNSTERRTIFESMLDDLGVRRDKKCQQAIAALAADSVGFVPADFVALVRHFQLSRFCENSERTTLQSFRDLLSRTQASLLRKGGLAVSTPGHWDSVAGVSGGAKEKLRQSIEWPREKKHEFQGLGLVPPRGILLYGPPGCAKTSLARAAATSDGVAFLSLSAVDVYSSSFVGDAESVVREAFVSARSASPCILFFDEIDAVLGTGGGASHGMNRGSSAEARVLSTFLNEMDGVSGSSQGGVLVLGATNRPWTIDAALLRKGRFDKVIYVPPPDMMERKSILEWYFRTSGYKRLINFDFLASKAVSGNLTGAEIVSACRDAAMVATKSQEFQGVTSLQYCLAQSLRNSSRLLSDVDAASRFVEFSHNH